MRVSQTASGKVNEFYQYVNTQNAVQHAVRKVRQGDSADFCDDELGESMIRRRT